MPFLDVGREDKTPSHLERNMALRIWRKPNLPPEMGFNPSVAGTFILKASTLPSATARTLCGSVPGNVPLQWLVASNRQARM